MTLDFPHSIRSYVLRQGRMTFGQKKGLEEGWERYGITLCSPAQYLNWQQVFGREAPVVLEIGFGMGESLVAQALAHPDQNFVGIEVHQPGVGACLLNAQKNNLQNLKVFHADAKQILEFFIPDQSLAKIYLLFPDPWPKTKHHKRRLVQPDFVQMITQKLQIGGAFHLATDWQPYAKHMLTVLEACSSLTNAFGKGNVAPTALSRTSTKFERKGQKLGHLISDLVYTRTI